MALDADSGDIIAHVMNGQDAGDASQVESLLDEIARLAISRPMALTTAS